MLNRKRVAVSRVGIGLIAVFAAALTSACAAGKHAQTAEEVPAIDGTTAQVGTMELHMFAVRPPDATTLHPVGSDVRVQVTLVNTAGTADTLTDLSTPVASGWGIYQSSAAAEAVQQAANTQSAPPANPQTVGSAPSTPASTSAPVSTSAPPSTSLTTGASGTGSAAATQPPGTSATGSSAGVPTSSSPAELPVGATSIKVPAHRSVAFGTPSTDRVLMLLNLTKKLYPGTSIPITVTFAHAGTKTITVPVQLTDQQSRLTLRTPGASAAAE